MATKKKTTAVKRGRPTKYTADLCERIIPLFAQGMSVYEVCGEIGIWTEAFYNWVKQYPEFSNAYKKGLELSRAWWEKVGRSGSIGKTKINPATWIFNMKNRFNWTDRTNTEISAKVTTVAELTPEERDEKIKNYLEKIEKSK